MSETQNKKLLKQPGVEQTLLKKELNLPSKEVRQATRKEQALIHSFGNKPVDYEKYRDENPSPVALFKRRPWIRFKSELDAEKEAAAKKPEEQPIAKVIKELAPKVLIDIVDSKLPKEQKEELKALFEELRAELQNPEIKWELIIPLLKKSLDYDLKTAALIVHLTSACQLVWEKERERES